MVANRSNESALGPAVCQRVLQQLSDRLAGVEALLLDVHRKSYASSSQVAELVPRTNPPPSRSDGAALTRREWEVLELLADGCTDQEIGRRLSITYGTVRTHLGHVGEKLGSHRRTELAAWYHSHSR